MRRQPAVLIGLLLAPVLLATPAVASPPEGFEVPPETSGLWYLTVFFGAPLLVAAVLAVLVYLPSMMKRRASTDLAVSHQAQEWFGGPRGGAVGARAATDAGSTTEPGDDATGGASARW